MTEITTLEQLRELDGKKITCKIDDVQVDDCLVTIQDSIYTYKTYIFLLQNEKPGLDVKDLKGYQYSWGVTESTIKQLSDIYPVIEPDSELVRVKNNYEGEIKDSGLTVRPSWLEGISNEDLRANPILVYFDDKGEEEAIEEGYIRLLVGYNLDKNTNDNEPYRILDQYIHYSKDNYKSLTSLLEDIEEVNWNGNALHCTTSFTHAVPVRASDWEVEEETIVEESKSDVVEDTKSSESKLIAVPEEARDTCIGCHFNPNSLEANARGCNSDEQIIDGKDYNCDDNIIYKLAPSTTSTPDSDLATQIGEVFVSLGKEKIEKLLELLTKID